MCTRLLKRRGGRGKGLLYKGVGRTYSRDKRDPYPLDFPNPGLLGVSRERMLILGPGIDHLGRVRLQDTSASMRGGHNLDNSVHNCLYQPCYDIAHI